MTIEFEETKKRLSELASVVNEFKSEAVQLKVLEWVFHTWGTPTHHKVVEAADTSKKPKRTKKKKISNTSEQSSDDGAKTKKSSRSSGNRPGPGKMIDRLIAEGYFKTRRTMAAIIDYCKEKNALVYDTGDLSPTLGRAIRAEKLEREKNQDNQYEYFQP